jgi:hypothetical protein
MDDGSSFGDFDSAIRRLATSFDEWVRSQMGSRPWRSAHFEVRYAADGSSWNDKMRVRTAGSETIPLGTTNDIRRLLVELNDLRRVLGWYSLGLELRADGSVEVGYGYDPDAVNDPSFFND